MELANNCSSCEHIFTHQVLMNLWSKTFCLKKKKPHTTHGEQDRAISHIGPAFQLLFTRIHINLPHHARTHPYTCYLHVHPADENTYWNKYSNNQPRPGWEGGVKKKKKNTRDLSPVLSLVTVIPQQILTRPGHIFNLWPNSTATERPASRSHSVCSVGGVVVAEARDTSPEGGKECGCLCQTQSNVNSSDAVCHCSPVTRLSCVSLSHLQPLWKCF